MVFLLVAIEIAVFETPADAGAKVPRCMRAVSNLGGLLWLSVSGSGSRWAVPDFEGRSRISSKDLGFQWNAFEISEEPQVSMRVSNFNQGSQNRLEVPDRNDWCRISMIGVRSQRAAPNLNEWCRRSLRKLPALLHRIRMLLRQSAQQQTKAGVNAASRIRRAGSKRPKSTHSRTHRTAHGVRGMVRRVRAVHVEESHVESPCSMECTR